MYSVHIVKCLPTSDCLLNTQFISSNTKNAPIDWSVDSIVFHEIEEFQNKENPCFSEISVFGLFLTWYFLCFFVVVIFTFSKNSFWNCPSRSDYVGLSRNLKVLEMQIWQAPNNGDYTQEKEDKDNAIFQCWSLVLRSENFPFCVENKVYR